MLANDAAPYVYHSVKTVSQCLCVGTLTWVSCAVRSSRVADVAPLAHLSSVDLSGSWCLDDVRPLARVRTLNLTDCTALVNVEALRGVDDLNLTNCYRITTVRALRYVITRHKISCRSLA